MSVALGAIGALKWLKFVPTAVGLVEKILPGKGRGREKKQVATEIINELVKELPTEEQPSPKQIDEEIEAVVPKVKAETDEKKVPNWPTVEDIVGPKIRLGQPDNTIIDIHIRVTLDQIVDLVKRGVFR